jgi:hypothetical protein
MHVPLGTCDATLRIPALNSDTPNLGVVLLVLAGVFLSVGVWLGLIMYLFRSPLVRREHRVPWLLALTVWFPLSAPVFYFSYLWRTPEEKAARPDSNRSHLLKLWGVAGAFGALVLVGLVAALARGQYTLPVLGLVMVPIVLILIRAKQWRLRRLLRRANPELILEYMAKETRGLKWVPHGDCLSAGSLASAAATLGDFDRARRELAAVSWDGRPPLYQGLRDSAAALLALFEERNPEKALALARQARSLSDVSGPFPSANGSRAALDATVAAAELLSGEHTPDLVATVEAMV